MYKDLTEQELKKNLLDKLMNTGTIVLNKQFKIGPINKPDKIYPYFLKLVEYYKRTRLNELNERRENGMM